MSLRSWGFRPEVEQRFEPFRAAGQQPARVVAQHQHVYRLATEDGERLGAVTGRFRHEATASATYPVAGDWVAVSGRDSARVAIHGVVPRLTRFSRRAAGEESIEQVVAANVDTVFLVGGLDGDFNPRRIERGLVLAWESGARPVVVLNKSDLCDDVPARLAEMAEVAPGVDIHAISAGAGAGLEALAPYLREAETVALIGSSGVGKSTIVNRLIGEDLLRTQTVRSHDQRGKHTTTHRELIVVPGGALLLDTPGMRELQLWTTGAGAGLGDTFEDVAELAQGCAFRDCAHQSEPDCAVRGAAEGGRLDPVRLASYLKLQADSERLARDRDVRSRQAERARWRTIHKTMRNFRPRG